MSGEALDPDESIDLDEAIEEDIDEPTADELADDVVVEAAE